MARYIDVDKLCEALKNMASVQSPLKQSTILGVVSTIENYPTTDVVPKSEYDCLEKLFNDMKQEAKGYLNRLYGIRADVAREIFAEIDELKWIPFESEHYVVGYDDIAELKKKYTEYNMV